jgi:protein-S-isoprenylcysteine O-methyltransferase Ste14
MDTVMTFFDYFQIASVVIFLLIIASRVVYMLTTRGVNPIAIGGGKKGLVLIVELLAFGGLLLWMIEVVAFSLHADFHIFPSPLDMVLIDSNVARIAGVVLVSIGLLVFMAAFVSFGDSWRVGFDVNTPGALVTGGIFAFSRNPIYLFLDLWFIGIFLLNGRLIFLIFALLTLVVIHWQILQEETFLTKLYGQPYDEYREGTRRYL